MILKSVTTRLTVNSYVILVLAFLLFNIQVIANSRNSRSNLENLASLAFEHGVKVREQGSCRTPRPEIVYVHTANPSKVYLPRGTILHRCSDSTGCCPQASQACRPIQTETVELYFFTVTLLSNNTHRHKRLRQQQNIERISYVNHTKCACVDFNSSSDDDSLNEV